MKRKTGDTGELPEKHNRYAIQSIEKALDVIEVLSEHDSLSLIQLAELVNQPKSSLFRIMLTLEKRGYVSRSDEDGLYCLGYKQLVITKNLLERNRLRAAATTEMQKLVDKYGDTVNLCVLSEGEILYVEIIEGTYALRMSDRVGSKAPFHATATGKAISASLRAEEVRRMAERTGLPQLTPNTITDLSRLMDELYRIRELGYALDNEECILGARCVAAPIFNMFGRVEGAISLSGAKHRFPDDRIPSIAEDVKAAAAAVSKKRGYIQQ
jgi:IclR family acetate operon transcriptional repressor